MLSSHRPMHRGFGVALAALLLLTSCGTPDQQESDDDVTASGSEQDAAQNPIPAPEYEDDETIRLPIGLVTPLGQNEALPADGDTEAPVGDASIRPHQTEIARSAVFGCDNRISVVRTTPIVTEDPTSTALEFLLTNDSYRHGSPEFINALSASTNLSLEGVDIDAGGVTVRMTGQPTVRSACEGWQILKQIEVTARVTTGEENIEILLDGVPLAEYLGLAGEDAPLDILELEPEVQRRD